jgi:hypothetical protein
MYVTRKNNHQVFTTKEGNRRFTIKDKEVVLTKMVYFDKILHMNQNTIKRPFGLQSVIYYVKQLWLDIGVLDYPP